MFQIFREKTGEAYWERRKKNNEAAKRSRDARRAKEDEVNKTKKVSKFAYKNNFIMIHSQTCKYTKHS